VAAMSYQRHERGIDVVSAKPSRAARCGPAGAVQPTAYHFLLGWCLTRPNVPVIIIT
jgi:hypothetical protein